ncbi:MAG: hypothetical protein SWK76_03455 [Actinomycetota bacterium]|nr:hypothetical protein [Actinomycetota bacterium]
MRRLRRYLMVMGATALIVSLAMVLPAGAQFTNSNVKVWDYELVIADTNSAGEVEKIQLVDWLALRGDGTVDVREAKILDEKTGWQGVHSFTTPTDDGAYIEWSDLKVDGDTNVVASTKYSEEMVEESRKMIPLDLDYKYWFDGESIENLDKITGKSGHFKLELKMTNNSEEMTAVEYEDPETGEMIDTEIETYLPMVIIPYDWYFDNTVFFNMECDETGLIFWMPDFYQVGWSIPLFPPATEKSHTIWVEADVKNFRMPTLTLPVAFVFPESNQLDPLPIFKAGLEELFEGVKQLDEGLVQAAEGIGSPGTADTLLYGISQVDSGLAQMNSATAGLPYAKSNLDNQLIPGVAFAASNIGSEGTPDTLLYGTSEVTSGLQGVKAGIGTTTSDNTLLWACAAMQAGLNELASGANDMITGIDAQLLPGLGQILGGLQTISAGLGTRGTTKTIIWGLDQISQSCAAAGPLQTALQGALQQLTVPAGGTLRDYVDNTGGLTGAQTATIDDYIDNASYGIATVMLTPALGGIQTIYTSLETATPNPIIPSLEAIKGNTDTLLIPGVTQVIGGLDNPTGVPQPGIKQGLQQIVVGVGSATTPDTLLFALDQITMGLNSITAGIGDASVPDTMLFGLSAVQNGLHQLKAGLASGDPNNPGIQEGLVLISSGLGTAIAGIGSAATPDTLLYGTSQIEGGLDEMKTGLEGATEEGTALMIEGLMDNLIMLNLSDAEVEAVAMRGEEFDHFFAEAEDTEQNQVRFVFQTKPTYSYKNGSSWITALILSIVLGLLLIAGGILLARRFA